VKNKDLYQEKYEENKKNCYSFAFVHIHPIKIKENSDLFRCNQVNDVK
jgi:hypothetical protein